MATIIYLGLGSNLGDKESNIEEALARIKDSESIDVIKESSFYKTTAVGGPPQDDYLNGVIKVESSLDPDELISTLKKIEQDMGRASAPKNYPRVIDIDILMYGDASKKTDLVTVPHPRMHERYFVLRGLNEIAGDLMHPVLGKAICELYKEVKHAGNNDNR